MAKSAILSSYSGTIAAVYIYKDIDIYIHIHTYMDIIQNMPAIYIEGEYGINTAYCYAQPMRDGVTL